MTGMKGMNPATVEAMAQELEACAAVVASASDATLAEVEALEWVGDDREAFHSEIVALHEEGTAIAASIRQLSEAALSHAAEQRTASAAA